MQAWWFDMRARSEVAALLGAPERIVARMDDPSWRVNQDVNHLGAGFSIDSGCLAFVARNRAELAAAMHAASQDVRITSVPGDSLAVRVAGFDAGGPSRPDRLAAGVIALVARRSIFGASAQPPPVAIQGGVTVRRLGALLAVLPG